MTRSQPEGFLAAPAAGDGPGVLVLHAWWGLNDTMKAICTRLAGSGFVAFAPDLYHGKVAATIPEAEALGSALDANYQQAKVEIAGATLYLVERSGQAAGGIGVVSFSLGAYYALDLSAADPDHIRSVVLFYGTGIVDFSASKAAYLGHFAENDPYETQSNVDELEAALREAGRPVTFYRYPGTGHWFFEPDRKDAYQSAGSQPGLGSDPGLFKVAVVGWISAGRQRPDGIRPYELSAKHQPARVESQMRQVFPGADRNPLLSSGLSMIADDCIMLVRLNDSL